MRSSHDSRSPRPPAYEVTVLGHLGPVLQNALREDATAAPGHEMIVRAVVPRQTDVVDLFLMLHALDLQVAEITEVT